MQLYPTLRDSKCVQSAAKFLFPPQYYFCNKNFKAQNVQIATRNNLYKTSKCMHYDSEIMKLHQFVENI